MLIKVLVVLLITLNILILCVMTVIYDSNLFKALPKKLCDFENMVSADRYC